VTFETDAGSQTREEQAARRQHPPHLTQHRRERPFVAREMEHGAADDRVGRLVRPWERLDRRLLNLIRGQGRIQRLRQLPHRANSGSIVIHGAHIEAVTQKEQQIASASAAGVEDAAAAIEPAAKQLIEKVDVYVAELALNFIGRIWHERMIPRAS
jgi:hypothetical protein